MRLINMIELQEALDTTINGRLCTEAWLGYAENLFLGFGDQQSINDTSIEAAYLLQTVYADWFIENKTEIIASADDDRVKARTAAELLVGCRAVSWSFACIPIGLEIAFENALKVVVKPMTDVQEDVYHKVAWILRMPDGYYWHVRWDGTLYALFKDEPDSHEPPVNG